MAQLVVRKNVALKGTEQVGDVVSIHDDDVTLTGYVYEVLCEVVSIPSITAAELTAEGLSYQPQTRTDDDTGKTEWYDGSKWRRLKVKPQHSMNIGALTASDRGKLKDKNANRRVLWAKVKGRANSDPANQEIVE